MITVLPEGGLCNRMRVVASALLLAQKTAQPLRVLWYQTPDFNARFDAIFDITQLPFEVVEGVAMSRPARLRFRLREVLGRLRGERVFSGPTAGPGSFKALEAVQQLQGRQTFIRSNSKLIHEQGMHRCFKPGIAVHQALDPMLDRLSNSVSVHVRRTDNAHATAKSPLVAFAGLMKLELQSTPDTSFFVATDSPETMTEFIRLFGNRVWQHPKRAYRRDDPTAIIDAAIDLYALAHGRKLIGSHWSSFTDTAAELRDIPCVIAGAAS